mmetsp:Transcript_17209/g.38774  ORF Transcript_17209/g.38774 Transcript_17209/m.38774 type:complete len:104 (-) Transcript_17209:2328-2639(-)
MLGVKYALQCILLPGLFLHCVIVLLLLLYLQWDQYSTPPFAASIAINDLEVLGILSFCESCRTGLGKGCFDDTSVFSLKESRSRVGVITSNWLPFMADVSPAP